MTRPRDIDPLGAKVAFWGLIITLLFAFGAVAAQQRALAKAEAKTIERLFQ